MCVPGRDQVGLEPAVVGGSAAREVDDVARAVGARVGHAAAVGAACPHALGRADRDHVLGRGLGHDRPVALVGVGQAAAVGVAVAVVAGGEDRRRSSGSRRPPCARRAPPRRTAGRGWSRSPRRPGRSCPTSCWRCARCRRRRCRPACAGVQPPAKPPAQLKILDAPTRANGATPSPWLKPLAKSSSAGARDAVVVAGGDRGDVGAVAAAVLGRIGAGVARVVAPVDHAAGAGAERAEVRVVGRVDSVVEAAVGHVDREVEGRAVEDASGIDQPVQVAGAAGGEAAEVAGHDLRGALVGETGLGVGLDRHHRGIAGQVRRLAPPTAAGTACAARPAPPRCSPPRRPPRRRRAHRRRRRRPPSAPRTSRWPRERPRACPPP